MSKLIVANWKMNPQSPKEAKHLFNGIRHQASGIRNQNVKVIICPPFPYISNLPPQRGEARQGRQISNLSIGAQDVFWEDPPAGGGAYTGEVSATMLKNLGAEYVIIGHSERRHWLKETDEMINKKVLAALKAGFKVILCVGESLAIRRRGMIVTKRFVRDQLVKDLKGIRGLGSKTCNLIVAYEPVWAISTSRGAKGQDNADTPDDAVQMIRFTKSILASRYALRDTRIIYGGSVNPRNARVFLERKEIDGALVGGASLKSDEFHKIMTIASRV